ncbi:hypothetical protein TNCV_2933871 [Trichonephila clavipes]|nr:hypothetical protein TNCV_2933871 [Trichonephila clavipes]
MAKFWGSKSVTANQMGTTADRLVSSPCIHSTIRRRIRRQCQRILDQVCIFNHIVNYQPTVMEKGQSSEWPLSGLFYSDIGNIDCYLLIAC